MGGSGYRPRVTVSLRVGGALGDSWGGQACVCQRVDPPERLPFPLGGKVWPALA